MPDTGAPWNIPYVASTDLVSDWPADSLALANAIDAGLDAANVGIGTNVAQTVKTDTFSTTSSSFTTVTGLSVAITPTSATAKVLVICQITYSSAGSNYGSFKMTRGGTDVYRGDAAGSRTRSVFAGDGDAAFADHAWSGAIVFLDSPATTSSTTYQVEAAAGLGTLYVNRSFDDVDDARFVRGASSITAIEVAV